MPLLKVICWALIFIIRIRFPPGKYLATILNCLHFDLLTEYLSFVWFAMLLYEYKSEFLGPQDPFVISKTDAQNGLDIIFKLNV